MVVISIAAFERREKLLDLKEKLLIAEEQRIIGKETISSDEVYKRLKEKIHGASNYVNILKSGNI